MYTARVGLAAGRSRPSAARRALWGAVALVLATACATTAGAGRPGARAASEALAEQVAIKQIEVQRGSDPALLAPWTTHAQPSVRAAAALALGRLQSAGGIPLLAALAADPTDDVRRDAAFALGLILDPASETALLARLPDERDAETRVEILRALGRVGSAAATPALLDALTAPAAPIRAAAATALGVQAFKERMPGGLDVAGADRLTGALDDEAPEVRRSAAYALVRVSIPEGRGPAIVDRLVAHLTDPDPMVRATVARAIGAHGVQDDGTRLAPLLADPIWEVRVGALRAMGQLGGPTAAWLIRPGLDDAHPLVKEQALLSLGKVGDPQALEWIEPFLSSPEVGLATAAIGTLAKLAGPRAIKGLDEAAQSPTVWIRAAACDALGDLDAPSATASLVGRSVTELDPRVMVVIADALGRRDPSANADAALLRLLARGDAATVTVVAGIIADRKMTQALPDLTDAWRRLRPGRDYEAQIAVLEAALILEGPASLTRAMFEAATEDPDERVASVGAAAMKKLFNEDVEPWATRTVAGVSSSSMSEAHRTREAWIDTSRGTLHVELYPDVAPITVANFARLARSGYFNGLLWHRVVPAFVAQAGSPREDGWGGPGYTIPDELNPRIYEPGTLGMALSGPDTGGSQFFITHGYEPHLDGTYTVFGRVLEGMDVVDALVRNDPILSIRFDPLPEALPDQRTLEAF